MPWLRWWDTEPPTFDGAARWNTYMDPNTGEEIFDMPSFMLDRLPDKSDLEKFKAGPYAFS